MPAKKQITSASPKEPTDFEKQIVVFSKKPEKTLSEIYHLLNGLQLPRPEELNDFSEGSDGALLFSSRYGIVMRFERTDSPYVRMNDNPWVLQPIASYIVGDMTAEICPGIETTCDEDNLVAVSCGLPLTGYRLDDEHVGNVGLLPVASPIFTEGIPVLIDRPSLREFNGRAKNNQAALADMEVTEDPQAKLYAPLRRALRDAWPKDSNPDKKKVAKFWRLCEAFTQKGTLIAGWDHDQNDPDGWKQDMAADSAYHYDLKIAAYRR